MMEDLEVNTTAVDFPTVTESLSNFTFSSNETISCDIVLGTIEVIFYTIYSLIFVVSIVGNGTVCYIVISSSRMRNVTNYFIMNLAIADILMTIFCVPVTAVQYLQNYWPFGAFTCPLVNHLQVLTVFVSAYTMLVISVDRYLAIMWPLKPRMSKRVATTVILSIWFFSAVIGLPIAIVSVLEKPDSDWHTQCEK